MTTQPGLLLALTAESEGRESRRDSDVNRAEENNSAGPEARGVEQFDWERGF